MAKAHFILILTLAAFRLFAQPALPTTNRTFAPIANPYSGSWIYYTTDSVSGLGYLNGASIPYVTTVSNGVVTYVNTATNGFVTAGITNGLATTNFVLSQNFVTAAVTNGLASISYVNTGTNYVLTNVLAQLNATSNALAGQIIASASPSAVWAGTSGNTTLTKNSTYYGPPNSDAALLSSDASGSSRVPVTRGMTLTNLYVVVSGGVGSGASTLTIMTNGVATHISVSFTGTTPTTGNDTTDSVAIPAGTEIGVKVVTPSGSANAVKWEWSFEGW